MTPNRHVTCPHCKSALEIPPGITAQVIECPACAKQFNWHALPQPPAPAPKAAMVITGVKIPFGQILLLMFQISVAALILWLPFALIFAVQAAMNVRQP